jgi:hypothetical protein
MVEVTTISEGREFDDLGYPNEEEGIEKLVDAKGTFILWPCKDIIVKTHLSSIVSPQSIETRATPTSNMLLPAQDPNRETHPQHQQPELLDSTGRGIPSPPSQDQQPEFLDNTGRGIPSPPQDQHLEL